MDLQLFNFFNSFANYHWSLDWLFVFLGQYLPYVLAAASIFLIFWTHRQWRQRLYFIYLLLLAVLIGRGLIAEIVRFFYYRPRPFKLLGFEPLISHLDNAALPSAHAVVFFILAVLMLDINKSYFWYFLAGAVLISLGRVISGVHWPADILIGAAIGIGSALAVKRLLLAAKS